MDRRVQPAPQVRSPALWDRGVHYPDRVPVEAPVADPVHQPQVRTRRLWHVVLLNDDDHTYEYVIEMLGKVFGHTPEVAFRMAQEVDTQGRVIVDTTTRERAELKQEQIHSFGPDPRLPRSQGGMSAELEEA